MQQGGKEEIIIPLLTLKSGNIKYKDVKKSLAGSNETSLEKSSTDSGLKSSSLEDVGALACSLVYEKEACNVFFKIPDMKLYKKAGEVKHIMLECADITAADLKVTTKFGSWDTMTCRLLVECRQPLNSWSTIKANEVAETSNSFGTPLSPEQIASISPDQVTYVRKPQESCMVKATFDVVYVSHLRDLLHMLKLSKLKERKNLQEKHRKGLDQHVPIPSKIKEGLPEWVNYIPAKWYSSTVRQVIEYLLVLYMVLTLMWAVWQLYKHVEVIRSYLRPLVKWVERLLAFLKGWFKWLDAFTESLSRYWWTYMKPIYVLITPLYAALAHLFKPLRNVAGLVSVFVEPVVRILKPLLQSASALLNVILQTLASFWNMAVNSSLMQLFFHRCDQLGVTNLVHRFSMVNLDPLKAQVLLIQHLLIRCFKQIFVGFKFLMARVYYMHLFVKRERAYASEGQENMETSDETTASSKQKEE